MTIHLDNQLYNIIISKNNDFLYIKLFNKINYQHFDKKIYIYNILSSYIKSTSYIKSIDELFKIISVAFDTVKSNNLDILSPNISELNNFIIIYITETQSTNFIICYNMVITFTLEFELEKCSNDEQHIVSNYMEMAKVDTKLNELIDIINKQEKQILDLQNIVKILCLNTRTREAIQIRGYHGNRSSIERLFNTTYLIMTKDYECRSILSGTYPSHYEFNIKECVGIKLDEAPRFPFVKELFIDMKYWAPNNDWNSKPINSDTIEYIYIDLNFNKHDIYNKDIIGVCKKLKLIRIINPYDINIINLICKNINGTEINIEVKTDNTDIINSKILINLQNITFFK